VRLWHRAAVLFMSVALLPTSAAACSCLVSEPWFLSRVKYSQVVIVGDVAEQSGFIRPELPTLMLLNVRQVLKGVEGRAQIWVAGDRGADCRSYITSFKPGTSWVFVLHALAAKDGPQSSTPEYELPGCGGIWWARLEGDHVYGILTQQDYTEHTESRRPLAEVRGIASEAATSRRGSQPH